MSAPTSRMLRILSAAAGAGMPAALPYDLRRGLFAALVWMCSAEIARAYAFGGLELSLVWPPDGIAFGLVLAYGRAVIPAIGGGVLVWHALRGIPPGASLLGAGALMLALWVVWRLVSHDRLRHTAPNPVSAVVRYHLFTLLPAVGIMTALGSLQYMPATAARDAEAGFTQVLLVMAVSELFGVLLFTRLTELVVRTLESPGGWRALAAEVWQPGWFAGFVAVLLLAAVAQGSGPDGIGSSARYFVFLLVAWAAYLGRPLFVHLATALGALTLLGLAPAHAGMPTAAPYAVLDQAMLAVCLAALGFLASATMEHRRAMEITLGAAARTDPLTGLLNERGLAHALASDLRPRALIGVDVCNLDRIEDLLGVAQVREIEAEIAAELRARLPSGTVTARTHDGFFVAALVDDDDADETARMLWQTLDGRRYEGGAQVGGEHGGGRAMRLRVSLGVLGVRDGEREVMSADDVVTALALACQVASDRRAARPIAHAEAPELMLRARREQVARVEALEEALRSDAVAAFDEGLWLACQPIRETQGKDREHGVEVLLRWSEAAGGVIAPGEFLPLAERHGMMPEVDRWVVAQTVRVLAPHRATLDRLGKVAINLSGASMCDADLPAFVADTLKMYGLPASLFCFEITETAGIAQRAQAVEVLERLRGLGARTSLDDFGTGLATFDYLKAFPLDYVKIDGGFVREMEHNRVDQRIVAAICEVARAMGLRTVAEFVETPHQRALLAAYGVDFVQGFGIAPPLPLQTHIEMRMGPRR
ncbi:MAG: EAL domain-containing protein [Rhodocyclaceae bacterium]